ncbi:SPRY-domain-containing protein [Gigaspora margarita]|uniref:SPRY-domain-containing protein n=1 Tax=Gigaspora margarita TaxID=4874 RepID=A0A8H4AFN3_GIGMA|nr:SPRY-domain-containing protein [Gigaspora margarita]
MVKKGLFFICERYVLKSTLKKEQLICNQSDECPSMKTSCVSFCTYLNTYNQVNYTDHDADVKDVVIRTNYPIPSNCKLFYFEISIIDKSENGTIAIGICTESAKLKTMPGCEDNSWAYYNDNGDFYDSSIINVPYGPMFNTGDTIGCCLNFRKNTAFFTKNGIHLGIALRGLKDNLYACVGLRLQNGSIETNFGHQKFKYSAMNDDDIDDELLKDKWVNVLNRCNNQLTDVKDVWAFEARKEINRRR